MSDPDRDSGSSSDLPPQLPEEVSVELERLRARILALDEEIIRLIGERREVVLAAGRLQEELGLPVMDPAREAAVVRRAALLARELGVDEELTRDVIWRVIASAREAQEGGRGWGPPEYPMPPEG